MRLDFIQEQFKKKGFWNTFRYYFCRAMSKAALKLVGPYVAKHGKLHRNYIVFKNRTMQDMTDNARAFYEYLIQNEKYNFSLDAFSILLMASRTICWIGTNSSCPRL